MHCSDGMFDDHEVQPTELEALLENKIISTGRRGTGLGQYSGLVPSGCAPASRR